MSAIKIKPFTKPNTDKNYVENTWSMLRNAIHQIQQHRESELSYEELYRNAYNLVLQKHGAFLYQNLACTIKDHMIALKDSVEASMATGGFLSTLNTVYTQHFNAMLKIRDILLYLDKSYAKDHEPVFDLGLSTFRDEIVLAAHITDHIRTTLLHMIHAERAGDVIDRSEIKSACTMLLALSNNTSAASVYEAVFERHLLKQTGEYYRQESQANLVAQDAAVYLRKAEERIDQENTRAAECFADSTRSKILKVVQEELLEKHLNEILDMKGTGITFMLENKHIPDLRRMFRLFCKIEGGLDVMCTAVKSYLETTGRSLVQEEGKQPRDAAKYTQTLLDLRDKYTSILNDAFYDEDPAKKTRAPDPRMLKAINQAFATFINENMRAAEYTSLFIDNLLKKGAKELTEAQVEKALDDIMVLFRFLQDKDIFERYYKQHLAKRLLGNKTASDEAERGVINRLKIECGYNFTAKLEGMFKDIYVSRTTYDAFKAYIASSDAHKAAMRGIDLNPKVLTTVHWPTSATPGCILPLELKSACDVFLAFYNTKHSGRILTWQTAFGSADVIGRFQKGRRIHTLQVTTHHMILLLLFNNLTEDECISFKDIKERTNMGDVELRRCLQTLACGKARVLNKNPMTRDVADDDTFTANDKFASKLTRVKIQQIVAQETEPEIKATKEKVDEDRKHLMEAAIVRVMKARKTMHYAELVAEVTQQLSARFHPQPTQLKKRIESLIEREYLERTEADRTMYKYLA